MWGDSSDNSEELFVPCLWTIDVIKRYLKENDFSIMITYAFESWNPNLAKEQLDLLSLATWTAIQARALEGTTRCCHVCMVFRWVHTHTSVPDPWYCGWCYDASDPPPPLPPESYRPRTHRNTVSGRLLREFHNLLLYLKDELEDSVLYDKSLVPSHPLSSMEYYDGGDWSPDSFFL